MKLNRNLTNKIRYILDEFIPPILRDQYWFMVLPIKFVFKQKAYIFLQFKQNVKSMSDKEFANAYKEIGPFIIQRDSDLNSECLAKILQCATGNTVLEVGSGLGHLAVELSKSFTVTASDIVVPRKFTKQYPHIKFINVKAEALPFKDNSFDTVVTTHTLEHVQNLQKAISELRRVARKRIIIVVPKQRPYRYTFDLHLHFFPYPESLEAVMGYRKNATCEILGGDLLYVEDKQRRR